jgi:hypothetical protein
LAEAVTAAARRTHTTHHELAALVNSAAYLLVLGDIDGARVAAGQALALERRAQHSMNAAITTQHLATVAALRSGSRRAARLCGYVDAWYRSEGCERDTTERRTYEILLTALHEKLTDAEIEALAAEGALLSEDQAVAEALAM